MLFPFHRYSGFREVLVIFWKLLEVFERVRTCSDPFGPVWLRLDALGYVQMLFEVFRRFQDASDLLLHIRMHSDAFGCFRRRLEAFGRLRTFSTFFAFSSAFCRLGVAIIGEWLFLVNYH